MDPVDPFVVPRVPLDVAQVQETQAEPPSLAGVGQLDQQISDLFVQGTQLRTIAVAGLANLESPTGQRNTRPSSRHRILGYLAALRRPSHFFQELPFSKPTCILKSAYIRFYRRFSSSIAFDLQQDRPSRTIAMQPPAWQWMICASIYLLVFIRNLLVQIAEKVLLMQPLTFGEDYRHFRTIKYATVKRFHYDRHAHCGWVPDPSGPQLHPLTQNTKQPHTLRTHLQSLDIRDKSRHP